MNTQSNSYTFIYSVVLVVVVAALLAVVSLSLKDRQNANIENEKMQNILSSVNINVTADVAAAEYNKVIVESYVVKNNGDVVEGADAFNVDIAKEFKKAAADRQLPIYVANVNGESKYILPLYGKGLWGAIWGYVSVNQDFNTVNGTFFDHAGETPGLGAEITNYEKFGKYFPGKKVFNANGERLLKVEKSASAKGLGETEVDAISGGTLTSNGVEAMLGEYFDSYKAFLTKMAVAETASETEEPVASAEEFNEVNSEK